MISDKIRNTQLTAAVEPREPLRNALAQQVEAYLAAGGTITQVAIGASSEPPPISDALIQQRKSANGKRAKEKRERMKL